jgi:hypothetical protein
MSANGGWEEAAGFFLDAADFLGEDIVVDCYEDRELV